MKAVGIVASPRENGNSEFLTRHALKAIEEEGIDTELIRLADLNIQQCNGCMVCRNEERCPIEDDLFLVYTKMKEAEAIIIASPVHDGSASALVKAFMERAGIISSLNGSVFAGKVGGTMAVARRGGLDFTIAQLLLWFHIQGFYISNSTHYNAAFGTQKIPVQEQDTEGVARAWDLGKKMAFLVKKIYA